MQEKWTHGKAIISSECPCCKSEKKEFLGKRKDDNLLFSDMWNFFQCLQCKTIYLGNRPDNTSLPLAYQSYYTHSPDSEPLRDHRKLPLTSRLINGYLKSRFNITRHSRSSIGKIIIPLIPPLKMSLDVYGRHIPKRLCQPSTKLLDFGCGNGGFLLRSQEMGITSQGCDPDPKSSEVGQSLGLNIQKGSDIENLFPSAHFDVITLNHVIEHSTDIPATLNQLHSAMKEGGMLWLALPNPQALNRSALGTAWSGFHPPYHLTLPSQKELRRLLMDSGFSEITFHKRGKESPGLHRESLRIAQTHKIPINRKWAMTCHSISNVLACISHRWSNETIVTARKTS